MRTRTPLLIGALVLAVAGCGDDETSSATTDAPAAATVDATTEPTIDATTAATATDDTATDDTATDDTATDDTATSGTATGDTATSGTATGGSVGDAPAAGADPDSPFCVAAQAAEDADASVDFAGTPESIREQILASVEAGREVRELAPAEISPTVDRLIGLQEQLVEVLEAHDWDFVAASTSPEGQALFNDPELVEAGADLAEYLELNCGITQG